MHRWLPLLGAHELFWQLVNAFPRWLVNISRFGCALVS